MDFQRLVLNIKKSIWMLKMQMVLESWNYPNNSFENYILLMLKT